MRTNQLALKLAPDRHTYQKRIQSLVVFLLFPSYNHLAAGSQTEEFEDVHVKIVRKKVEPKPAMHDEEKPVSSGHAKKKGDRTRDEILRASRTVFTEHPYDVASLRMIGRQGNRDFTLIHHYFPTKDCPQVVCVMRQNYRRLHGQ